MRTFFVRSLFIPALATLSVAASLAAQERPSAVLSAPEVSQLISRAQPADHARVGAHFAALADQEAADAKRHTSMQQAYAGSTKAMAVNMSSHCKALASRSLESAANLREIAAYHRATAGGAVADAPRSAAQVAPTPGARVPTEAELIKLASGAETAADHRALGTSVASLATRHEQEAPIMLAMRNPGEH
jgi:hypothetical protein